MRVILLWLISLNLLLHGSEAVVFPLNDGWTLMNENRSIEVKDITVPSGVYSDLENAGITESVLFSFNDVELRWIALENWTYKLDFNLTKEDLNHQYVILTFNGLDTVANITLNDEIVGKTDNMFVRYQFDVKKNLVVGTNKLIVNFTSPVEAAKKLDDKLELDIPPKCPPKMYNGECHVNLLRKMQASFAWDWGLAAPSMGIWKNVFLDTYDSIVIRDITYELIDGVEEEGEGEASDEEVDDDLWTLKVSVHLETGLQEAEYQGVIACELIDVPVPPAYQNLHVKSDESGEFIAELKLTFKKDLVERWWPNGSGKQTLYGLKVQWEDARINELAYRDRDYYVASKKVNIGFRTIELVQEKMTNGLSFYFKVNGVPIFMKGSNWIPSHVLPEKSYQEEKVKELLLAARDAHMNMLRVWGGGVYESQYFYSLADEYGILIWQDLMFACAMYPADDTFLNSVRTEVKQRVRRLQYHPSIALYATNNENEVALRQDWYGTQSRFPEFANDYRKLYVETITDEIKKHDPSREVLTSSPSNGKYNGDREYGIGIDPQNPHFGDIHHYIVDQNAWKPEHFHQARFVSEYGFQSFPAGWREVMREGDNLTNLIDHRQHHPLKSNPIAFLVEKNLKVDFNSLAWDDKIYLSQLSQAMAMKTETEVYRSGRDNFMNTMGALYWQLNDVWVAPSWSSIEYNGNFKILHHWMEQIFAPQTLITQIALPHQLQIFIINDEVDPAKIKPMTVKMNIYKWDNFRVMHSQEWPCTDMQPNTATLVRQFDINDYLKDISFDVFEYMAEILLINEENGEVISKNHAFPGNFQDLKSVSDCQPKLKIQTNKCEKGNHKISLEVKIQAPAIFMHISLNHDTIKKYRLSKNGFMQFEPIQVVQVTFRNPDCLQKITVANFSFKTLNNFLM